MTGDLPPNPSDAHGADVPHHASPGEIPNAPAAPRGESLGGGDQHVDGAARDLHVDATAREPRDHAAPDTFEGDDDERHDGVPPGSSPRASAERHIESNPTAGLTAGQERAIVALMAEPSIAKAARSANVGERTLHTWLGDPGFSKAYREARRRAFAQAIALTHKMAAAAVQTLSPLFCTRTGGTITTASIRRLLPTLARAAGIAKRVHAHGLRHTHASELRSEGLDIGLIARQLGHADISTTARYLDHINPTAVIEAMGKRGW